MVLGSFEALIAPKQPQKEAFECLISKPRSPRFGKVSPIKQTTASCGVKL